METKETLARRTDPGTSHAAAAAVRPLRTTVRSRVEAILTATAAGSAGMTHDEIIAAYRRYSLRLGWPAASDSSIRTRCKELARDGLVEQVPPDSRDALGQSRFGRPSVRWRAASVQNSETEEQEGKTA